MFSQLFGSFLLRQEVVTPEQLMEAISATETSHIHIGTAAMYCDLLSPAEVDCIIAVCKEEQKSFAEAATNLGYLTADQVRGLKAEKIPDYVLMGEILVRSGVITNEQLQTLMVDYQNENEFYDLEINSENQAAVNKLVERFFLVSDIPITQQSILYLQLLFNNLVRHIGDDFAPLAPIRCTEYATNFCVSQSFSGPVNCTTRIDMTQDVAQSFATRYAGEEMKPFSEYIAASIEDFINLHNGLFVVNISNENSVEITLNPPKTENEQMLIFDEETFIIPLVYSFGKVQLLVSFYSKM